MPEGAGGATSPREKRSRAAIAAALETIEALGEGKPLRLALSRALASAGGLGGKERRHAAVAARGVARWLRPIDAALRLAGAPKAIPADRAMLRYLAWRVMVEGEAPALVARALALPGPRRPRVIHDPELLAVANALPAREALPVPPDPVRALAARASVPDLVASRLAAFVGLENAAACLAALNAEPRLALRVNAARASRDTVLASLRAAEVDAEPGADPLAIVVSDRAGLFDAPAFRKGLVEVQDEGSLALVRLCGAKSGERWLDFCAGSGGKALALAALGAKVSAWDADRRRLGELPRRSAKARTPIEVIEDQPEGLYDGVLVDAPCSGSGALSREPDARWRIAEAALARFAEEQPEILARACAHVAPGGALVYGTCSIFREENEEVVRGFLAAHPEVTLEEEMRRWPQQDPGGGFYGARLRKARTPARARPRGR